MSDLELDGRVALVTGAGRGIGRATALSLARAGARVMGVARTAAQLEEVEALHPGISVFPVGLDTAEGCHAAVEETRRRLGPIQIFVNNAGVGSSDNRPVWEEDPAAWHATMAINLHAPFELMRLVAPDMMAAGEGRIIVVSSTSGQSGDPSMSAYCASKHGVIGLVRAAALDLARYGVTCNAVNPGWVRTEMAERSARRTAERQGMSVEEVWAERVASYAAGRLPTAEEVAETIRFLAGPRSSGITGETITIALGGR